MSVHFGIPVAGRRLPDEEVAPSTVSNLAKLSARLRQRTLFEYVPSVEGPKHERGLSKEKTEFICLPQHTLPWGDHVISGTEVNTNGVFRLISHNVNGLSTANNHADVVHMASSMAEKSVALFGLQETNRNFERPAMVDTFHRVIRSFSTHHHGAVSSAKLQWPCDYQPGGTAVSIRNQWATRFLERGADVYGRWSWLTLAGRGTTKISFISAYRVCDGASEASITSKTVRAQQEWMYADRGKSSINLRTQFVSDMTVLVNDMQQRGHDVVLMMDANEANGAGSAVERLLFECQLTDVHAIAGRVRPPATYHRGTEKIDFVLVSARLGPLVTASSILGLHDGYLLDHRALVVDFDANSLFMSETSPIVPPSARRLTTTNPRAVHTYVQAMLQQIALHDIAAKVFSLQYSSENGTWTDEHVRKWEQIDLVLEEARLSSERKCKTKNSGQFPWSPALQIAGSTLLYWRMRLCKYTSQQVNQATLAKLEKLLQLKASEVLSQSFETVRSNIRKAHRKHRKAKANAVCLREEFLRERATFLAASHGMSEGAACAAIEAREKSSKQFRHLRQIFRKGASGVLDRLDVPNSFAVLRQGEEIPRIQLVVKEQIEEVLVPHTVQRFCQHKETPFGDGVRQASLGQDCMSLDAAALLSGTYDRELEALSAEATVWLKELKQKDFVHAGALISTTISRSDWICGWKKMRESTASAPGGHYGHYKTAALVATLPEDHADYTLLLSEIYSIMLSLPLKHGFAPSRWQKCIDAILEKIPGQPRIEKLRIIMLYGADFNFMLKLIWGKRLVRHAELYRCLGTENFGSRSGHQAQDAQLGKLFLYEYARLTRTSLITVDNDAKSCYDRIIKPLAMIACIAVGLPLLAAAMHNRTHYCMQHKIKTRHGTLRPYSGTANVVLEGTGQGSGASPAIWLIYSVSLLRAFQKFSPGMNVSSPFESLLVTILAIFYVDDGMPGVNDSLEMKAAPLAYLLEQAEQATQSWEKLLFASGGALELSKCFAYVVYWDLSEGRHRLILPDEIPGGMQDGKDTRGPIRLTYGVTSTCKHALVTENPWVGRRTLGVRIAPAGTWQDEFEFRRAQSRELAFQIAGSVLPRETARIGYQMMVRPKLEYPLAITQFTQIQCDKITSPVIRACLSKMGYNCNSPKEVIYGPSELFGFGIHDYFIEQGIKQLTALIGHVRQNSETSRMMRIELQWCQVLAGTAKHLLGDPTDPIDYIETCWIMCICDFLRTYNLRVDFTATTIPTIQCGGDEFIMDGLRLRGGCTATELQRLNACRMFLQVSRLSDITSANGRFLKQEVLIGKSTAYFASVTRWPRQGRPPHAWWKLWSSKLKTVFSSNGSSLVLRESLGEWDERLNHDEWATLFSAMSGKPEVYQRRPDGEFEVYTDSVETRGNHVYVSTVSCGRIDRLPADAVPANMGPFRKDGRRRVMCCKRALNGSTGGSSDCGLFAAFIQTQEAHIRNLLQHIDLSDTTAAVMVSNILTSAPMNCGSDGGLLNDRGTFGYVWANRSTQDILASGNGNVPGHNIGMSSTRTELCGVYAALCYVQLVSKYYHLVLSQQGLLCTFYCDSKAALQRIQDLSYAEFGTTWRCRANYDLEAAIRKSLQDPHLRVHWEWVRGHAIRRKKRQDFTWAEILNDHADKLATSARTNKSTLDFLHWPEQDISLVGPRGRICGRLDREIRYCCTATDLVSYWQQRFGWTAQQAQSIDILGTAAASKSVRPDSARRIQKLRCGWLPVNTRESRSDPDRHNGCSACSPSHLVPETVDHIFQCSATSRRRAILDRFSSLYTLFRSMKTAKPLISAIQIGAIAWIEGKEPPAVETLDLPESRLGALIGKAYAEQTLLGWNVLFRGFWVNTWRLAQEEQYRMNRSRELQDTGENWSARAQTWFFETFEAVWDQRNTDEHGADEETQRRICLKKCEQAIQRLYYAGKDLLYGDRHPFRDSIEDLLQQPVNAQELWIGQTEAYMSKAFQRARVRLKGQLVITNFFTRLHG